jgi:hypothetical protein
MQSFEIKTFLVTLDFFRGHKLKYLKGLEQ